MGLRKAVFCLPAGTQLTASGDSTQLLGLDPVTQATYQAGIPVGAHDELALDFNITNITGSGTPTLTLFLERLGADGVWYPIYTSSAITAQGKVSTSLGYGQAAQGSFGLTVRVRWTISGTTPVFTLSASIIGK